MGIDFGQIITAGYFATEDFKEGPKWEEEVKMYSKCINPKTKTSMSI